VPYLHDIDNIFSCVTLGGVFLSPLLEMTIEILPLICSHASSGAKTPASFRLWRDLIVAFQYLKGAHKQDGDKLFSRACCNRTRGNGCKLKEGRFGLDIRKKFFMMRVVKPWPRLPREAVDAPSLKHSRPGWMGL